MDDKDIPGLLEYVNYHGIVDSPVNRKAYRLAFGFMKMHNEQMPAENYLSLWIGWSERYDRFVAYLGYTIAGGFIPMLMVQQAELAVADAMDIRCSPGCEGDGEGACNVLTDPRPHYPKPVRKSLETKDLNDQFMHCVQSWDGPVPNFEELARFYIIGKQEGEGGAEKT